MSSAKSPDRPHPWTLSSTSAALVDPCRSLLPHRTSVRQQAGTGTATADRMLLDEHRSAHGRCVRCECEWPCMVTIEARTGRST
ncbi:hypothetical protein ABH930_003140 [Kitasatospora sp. GAS204A]|uniref:hypothetical protein n=1 Tax=unclassified Kitasatospora TaxID=2633591 RepID=UPI00247573DE|nr:hypothetical protein [Kitasatospora sp. GAS204B]MDH6117499.1 hypothetical protein [Kitasatospora sp. GAS204B]